jgi:hypothetical protein
VPGVDSDRPGARPPAGDSRSWYLLIHQLPPRPLYLRAKIRRRLARVGALALKKSVYVLPPRDDCLEDLQWIAQEATAGGGEAFVCHAVFVGGVSDDALVAEFTRRAAEAYEGVKAEVAAALAAARRGGARGGAEPAAPLARLRRRLEESSATDFFGGRARKEAEAMVRALERQVHGGAAPAAGSRRRNDLVGRTWVTRTGPRIDRLASAWLIRRFVDPGARFRFVPSEGAPTRPGEMRFDMVGAEFGHAGDRCTIETFLARLSLHDPALRVVAEIVHDIDLKDGKFGRPEVPGVRQLVDGLVRAHAADEERLARGLALFDDLYASFRGPARPAAETPRSRAPRGGRAAGGRPIAGARR